MFSRSVFTLFTAGLAAFASAYTTPVGDPSGNPIIKPGLNEIVPAGKPYTITWTPTTSTTGTVTLVLLRGPSTNVIPIATIVEGIPNSGAYSWTPSTSLEADVTHYGLQLIVDATGQYQYSTQFGISNAAHVSSSSVAASTAASTTAVSTVIVHSASKSASVVVASTPCSTSTPVVVYSTSSRNSTSTTIKTSFVGTGTAYSHYIASTGAPHHNSTVIQPSKPLTVPSSLMATATASASIPVGTGAAGHVQAGLGLAGAMAALVMAL